MPHPAVISKAEQKEEAVPSGSLALPCKASGCMSGVDTAAPVAATVAHVMAGQMKFRPC